LEPDWFSLNSPRTEGFTVLGFAHKSHLKGSYFSENSSHIYWNLFRIHG
jgi:hypothetical protein